MEAEAYHEMHRLELEHWWYQGMRLITDSLLDNHLNVPADLRILDAGCGTGGNLTALAKRGPVQGFDYATLAVAYAYGNHAGRLCQASVEALPYADAVFDLVTSFDVLYAREVQDDVRALREFARVVRPGGSVLVRLPALRALRGPHDAFVHGLRRYTAAELRRKFNAAGLHPVRLTYANSFLLLPIFVTRKAQSFAARSGLRPVASDVRPAPGLLHHLLRGLLSLEARWIGSGRSFPAGVSLFGLAVKPV